MNSTIIISILLVALVLVVALILCKCRESNFDHFEVTKPPQSPMKTDLPPPPQQGESYARMISPQPPIKPNPSSLYRDGHLREYPVQATHTSIGIASGSHHEDPHYLLSRSDVIELAQCSRFKDDPQKMEHCWHGVFTPKEVTCPLNRVEHHPNKFSSAMGPHRRTATPPRPHIYWKKAPGDCVAPNHPEEIIPNVSRDECQLLCRAERDTCDGFSYNPTIRRCVLKAGGKIDPSHCDNVNGNEHYWKEQLSSQLTHSKPHPNFLSAQGDCIEPNHPETVFTGINNETCENKCWADDSCAGYSYSPSAQRCVLKAGGHIPREFCGNKNGYVHHWKQQ